jgi:hypothetical protein
MFDSLIREAIYERSHKSSLPGKKFPKVLAPWKKKFEERFTKTTTEVAPLQGLVRIHEIIIWLLVSTIFQ